MENQMEVILYGSQEHSDPKTSLFRIQGPKISSVLRHLPTSVPYREHSWHGAS